MSGSIMTCCQPSWTRTRFQKKTEISGHAKRSVKMLRKDTATDDMNRVLGCFKNSNTKHRTHFSDSVVLSKGLLSPLSTNLNKYTVNINCYSLHWCLEPSNQTDWQQRCCRKTCNSERNRYCLLFVLSFQLTFYKSSFLGTLDICHSNASLYQY